MENKNSIFEKFKNLKNYISLNFLSFLGYLVFFNIFFTILFIKPNLLIPTDPHEVPTGTLYDWYICTLVVLQLILTAILGLLYITEKFILKRQRKTSFTKINNPAISIIFYIGFVLYWIPFVIFYRVFIVFGAIILNFMGFVV